MKRISFRSRSPLALVLLVVQALAASAAVELGPWSLLNIPAMSLDGANPYLARSNKKIEAAVQSLGFMGHVGGVAFGSEAKGVDGREIVSIAYDTNRPDGERLTVTIRSQQGRDTVARGHFADWLLVPTAQLAAGDDISCVTLFGKLKDPVEDQKHHEAGHSIVNYNSHLEGTLLGLRLMQSDLLLLDPDLAAELPRTAAGILLGAGERPPKLEENRRRAQQMNQFVSNLPGGPFSSYLICDSGVEIAFTVENGSLDLSGWPCWYCWRYKTRDNAAFAAAQKEANLRANEDLRREPPQGSSTDHSTDQARFDVLFDQHVSRALLEAMPDYSARISAEMKYTEGGNPAVYQALTSSMRLTALFRTARRQCPSKWQHFLESLPTEGIHSPEWVATVIPKPNMTHSESARSADKTH